MYTPSSKTSSSSRPSTSMHYWEPHSASIDFCETNYFHSNHIVEIHNTRSSIIGLSSFGVMGLMLGNHTGERRNTVAYLVLILIGIGSAGLHGTLHWFLQSADELPMMYLLTCLLYMCAEYDAPRGKPNYPRLPQILSLLATVNTIIYYCFQQFYLVFIFSFGSGGTAVLTWLHYTLYGKPGRSREAQHICSIGVISILMGGLPCWLYDMLQCKSFIGQADHFLHGLTPHVLWHFGAGFAAYCTIVSLECCRMEELGIPYKAKFIGGVFPLISTDVDKP